jgi:Rrf2 family cysteine metabolism transcriptional repressor
MLNLSRKAELGLLFMADLVTLKKGETRDLLSWAKTRGVSYRFLSRVAVRLKKAGLLLSKEGRGGGYALTKAPDKIKLIEIIEALEGKLAPVNCLRGEQCDLQGFCGHRQLMQRLVKLVERELNKMRLTDLC